MWLYCTHVATGALSFEGVVPYELGYIAAKNVITLEKCNPYTVFAVLMNFVLMLDDLTN